MIRANGRVCLLGDHNDWAGNCSLAAAIDRGIIFNYNKRDDDLFVVQSEHKVHKFEIEKIFSLDNLYSDDKFEGELKYVEAVVKVLKDRGYKIGPLDIDIVSDLPIKKGLSSSAALSVGAAKVFNEAFGLGMDNETIVDVAYEAENDMLGIGCGKMDQTASAYGGVVYIEFNPFRVEKIPLKERLYLVIGDLQSERDTKKILNTLNYHYFKKKDPKILKTFEKITDITKAGRNALLAGDVEGLGQLMNENQDCYDNGLKQFCPEELDSPKLYKCIDAARASGAFGAKWTGAGGNGSMIALTSKDTQDTVAQAIRKVGGKTIKTII